MRIPVLLLPVFAVLAGCASDAPKTAYVSRVDTISPETTPVAGADASMMLAQMPQPGGLVTKVREKSYPNGVSQQAILAGEVAGLGENHLEIYVQTAASNGGAGMLNIGPPSEAGMKREILARYPKVPMRIVTQPRQNSAGVFGLAIGRAGNGARCIFAWQWVDDIRRGGANADSGFTILGKRFGGSAPAAGATPASIRVHMCRKDATVDDLAATVEGLTLASPAIVDNALNPARRIEATMPVRETDSRGSAVMASAAPPGSLESALTPQKQTQVAADETPKPRRAARVARRKPAPAAQEGEEGVVVARRQAPAEQQQMQTQPAYAGGPRYLAPVAGMPASAPVVYGTPAPVASAAPTTAGLDPSLPAAAYRGPSGRPSY
ncbi:MAG TPA: cellulose biosynthesis protein BcsN [Rhodoblastus sp.]|nr:cellulose biosynthesis protein BcsN [Rhodoblastus sp.]